MAVSNNYEIKTYTLDGVAVQFAIPFDVNVDDYGNAINIVVNLGLDELIIDVDYTITGKTINYPDAVSHTGEKLTVFRRTPIEQPVDFVDNGNFTLEDIETGLDRSIMIEQETSANLDNTIRAQESAERAEQYKDIAIEKASDAEDWAVGTRSDEQTPAHSLESAKHWAEAADTSASMATSMRNQSAANALVSEGYAKGTQGGVPVESGDYYQDNSKYYKEQAGLSAGAASGSATSAYNSELAAAASEDKAHDWADKATDSEVEPGEYSAKHWASKASISSGSAAVSAYNAGLSETNAGTSAKDSEAYAVGTRGGTPVSSDDPAYHNNSKYYSEQIGQQTVTPDNAVTLTNKTIDKKDNVFKASPHTVSASETYSPTGEQNIVIDTASTTLTLDDGAYAGHELSVLILADCSIVYTGIGGSTMTDQVVANRKLVYTWTGSAWFCSSAPVIGDIITQYPDMDTPSHIYGGQWTEKNYGGAFFRTKGGDAQGFATPVSVTWSNSTTFTVSSSDADKITTGDIAIFGTEYRIMTKSGTTITVNSAFTDYSGITQLLVGQREALPNITGSVETIRAGLIQGSGTGVFGNCSYQSGSPEHTASYAETGNRDTINFSAALSSSIYKDGAHVQPNNITVKMWQRTA